MKLSQLSSIAIYMLVVCVHKTKMCPLVQKILYKESYNECDVCNTYSAFFIKITI